MTITENARQNGPTVRRLMCEAAEAGARLVQFPEGCLSGYAKEQIRNWDQADWPAVREEHRQVAALAAELRLWVVLGSTHRITPPYRPHNILYVIADDGRVVERYDKRYCSNTEILDCYCRVRLVPPDDVAADHAGVVGAVQGEVAQGGELGLDAVQPGAAGRCVGELDVVGCGPVSDPGVLLRGQVRGKLSSTIAMRIFGG